MTKHVEQDIAMQSHKIATYELIWVSERSVLSEVPLNYRHVLFRQFLCCLTDWRSCCAPVSLPL